MNTKDMSIEQITNEITRLAKRVGTLADQAYQRHLQAEERLAAASQAHKKAA
ncbi:hypothetical protein [Endozoicomonas montiporae]|uniref:Uncharacterized protein n=1 Tax=Endozoicomonas montiporae CL-33 TaxID=570277 RepID=A0A142BCF0_9GAMM|nr:hypothetical protein [Endozoicomonas montiporae]AMO56426.1 hypothetical protein EZMO1_2328 [Endozoicomonas montiporae CL-33]